MSGDRLDRLLDKAVDDPFGALLFVAFATLLALSVAFTVSMLRRIP